MTTLFILFVPILCSAIALHRLCTTYRGADALIWSAMSVALLVATILVANWMYH